MTLGLVNLDVGPCQQTLLHLAKAQLRCSAVHHQNTSIPTISTTYPYVRDHERPFIYMISNPDNNPARLLVLVSFYEREWQGLREFKYKANYSGPFRVEWIFKFKSIWFWKPCFFLLQHKTFDIVTSSFSLNIVKLIILRMTDPHIVICAWVYLKSFMKKKDSHLKNLLGNAKLFQR